MLSIVTDGGAEPKLAAKEAPPAQGKRRRGWFGFKFSYALAVVTALAGGAWLLLRGLAYWQANPVQLTALLPLLYPAPAPVAALLLSLAATLCGVVLLVAAAGLADRRHWGWLLLTTGAILATILAIAASFVSSVVDWAGLVVAFTGTVVTALPNVRTATISESD